MKKLVSFLLVIVSVFSAVFIVGCKGCKKPESANCHDYKINVTFDDKNMLLTGYEVVTFYNYTDTTITELKFNLYGNAYREGAKFAPILSGQTALAYPNGINYGYMTVDGVEVLGSQVDYSIGGDDKNVLIIPLSTEIFPEESITVKIDFTLKLTNSLTRTGYNDKTINLGNFYPILCAYADGGFKECLYYPIGDPFYSDYANYTVTLTLNEGFNVCSSGVLVDSKKVDSTATLTYKIQNAKDFAFVLSDCFDMVTGSVNGITVNYYYIADTEPNLTLNSAIDAIKTFSNLFGDYPYKTFSVAETGFYQGGMEYPAMVMISDALQDRSAINEVTVHETAHQWWYALVGNDEVNYAFLDEGLTEYSVALFYELNPNYGFTRAEVIGMAHKSYQTYCSIYDRLFGGKDTSMCRSLSQFTSEYEYVNIAYIKGALMFDYLRIAVSDEVFFKGLKNYVKNYSFKNATPDALFGTFEALADTNGFFNSWVSGEVVI